MLMRDLIGPQGGPEELIEARPTDQYMTGALYPREADESTEQELSAEANEDREPAADGEGSPGDAISMSVMRRPSSMGISFAIEGDHPRIEIEGIAGRYAPLWKSEQGLSSEEGNRRDERWKRTPVPLRATIDVVEGLKEPPEIAAPGLQWWVRAIRDGRRWQITVVLENNLKAKPGRVESERATFLQVGFRVRASAGCRLVPRFVQRRAADDDDTDANELIYRDAREWAVGHVCSATWHGEPAAHVESTWIPLQMVRSTDARGHQVFRDESKRRSGSEDGAFDAERLAGARSADELGNLLGATTSAYARWLDDRAATVDRLLAAGDLPQTLAERAREHLRRARALLGRMQAGIEALASDPVARRSFQLAQKAMLIQRRWGEERTDARLVWRPFQLGFQLLTVSSLASPADPAGAATPDRRTMDLLWFPTGGGKTEAYLSLIAFTAFVRRLREKDPDAGGGVTVIMRYTLRLLTVQQFDRAARLVLACEYIRRRASAGGDGSLGVTPFSIGLWVGSDATPNSVDDARKVEGRKKARQLARCPSCRGETLTWDADPGSPRHVVRCASNACEFSGQDLPVWTVDEDVYRVRPTLLIGTVDKFAQIVRRPETAALLGSGGSPPELIIQDELHLISGPLGTVTAVYESAIDMICTVRGIPPKIIGSTATIRRADRQVKNLFDRTVAQFPPPVLDADDSCFAVTDRDAPGRLYAGVTTAGRSPKFVLQAVCASLMQAAEEAKVPDADRDPYWTLVTYFNSLRELGGALVMMHDDVDDSIEMYAKLHGAPRRNISEEPLELTSRVPSESIPASLDRLGAKYPAQMISAVLATNMLSVGVDIPRLGLMVVNGQPKSMSEYIQATSRVGRGNVPGLIVSVYNTGRPRDRSHYEAFRTWHQTLYRDVEATSVTPFAPRARDRALHAAIVAVARHLVPGMLQDPPQLTPPRRAALQELVDRLVDRVRSTGDRDEIPGTQADAERFIEAWVRRGAMRYFWNDYKPADSLLVSAEKAAAEKAVRGSWTKPSYPTLNSMREVEPGVEFKLISGLARGGAR